MRQLLTVTFMLLAITIISCGDEQSSKDKKLAQIEKENQLLKQEIVRLSKEKDNGQSQSNLGRPVDPVPEDKADLSFLKEFDGKYPHDVKLLDNPALTKRLRDLLNERYKYLKETWAVETPMEIKNGNFIASACQAHNCGYTNFIIVYSFDRNILYAGVREEKIVKTYSEDGSSNEEIAAWVNSED